MFEDVRELMQMGGPVMYILAALGGILVFLGTWQTTWLLLWKCSGQGFFCSGAPFWSARALAIARSGKGFRGLSLLESIELCLQRAEDCLTRLAPTMRFLAQASTMLGFLGTVTGMVRVFNTVSKLGIVTPGDLAGGIYEALFTTVFGLALAIIGWGFVQIIESLSRRHLRILERQLIEELESEP